MSTILLAAVLGMVLATVTALAAPPAGPETPAAQFPAAPPPQAVFPETTYAFDAVMEGTTIKHDFIVENHGAGLLEIKKVQPD